MWTSQVYGHHDKMARTKTHRTSQTRSIQRRNIHKEITIFLYGPFCHGAHKLDLSTLFTTFFLWTSLPFILTNDTNFSFIMLLKHACKYISCTVKCIAYSTITQAAGLRIRTQALTSDCISFFLSLNVHVLIDFKSSLEYNYAF